MLPGAKIMEVKDKVQPVLLEEALRLKRVADRLIHNSYNFKGRDIGLCLFHS
jgi:hypothetical protein